MFALLMNAFREWAATVAILFIAATCRAAAADLGEILPWLDRNRVAFGMTRAEITTSRPAAVEMFAGFSDTPPRPGVPFSGGYMEGDPLKKPGSDIWLYGFKDDRLQSVMWGRKNDSTEADTIKIRDQLIKAYGEPTLSSIARVTTSGGLERITREIYLTAATVGYAVYLVATDQGGIEVTAIPASGPGHPPETFEESLSNLLKSGMTRNEGPPTILDILAKLRAP